MMFIIISYSPTISSFEEIKFGMNQTKTSNEKIELVLLHGEFYLYINANQDVNPFSIRYSFPPIYQNQTPIILEIDEDETTANILNYKIENEENIPNKIVNFTIGSMNKNEQKRLHFNYWVLVKNYNYSDLPDKIPIPKLNELPSETKKWLTSTEVVQKDNLRIRLRAKLLKFSINDVLEYAQKIATFTKSHRFLLFLIQYHLGLYGPQDALTTLKRNGECAGRSHLGCALFRAENIPARVVLAAPSYKFWYEIHYMVEYFSGSKYGWMLSEVHQAKTPYEPKNQIIMRICYPEDENNSQVDFLYSKMSGLERWFWIDNENVTPYYKDLKEGSKTRMINENEFFTEEIPGNHAMNITKEVYKKFEYYLAIGLTGENLIYFQDAIDNQMKAIELLKDSIDAYGYIYWMSKANEKYNNINLD